MNSTLKSIYKDIDLYGSEVFIKALKEKYKLYIPKTGAPATASRFIRDDLQVKKAIFHSNDNITVKFICPQIGANSITATARFF